MRLPAVGVCAPQGNSNVSQDAITAAAGGKNIDSK